MKTTAVFGLFFLMSAPLCRAEASAGVPERAALFITGLSGSNQFEEYFQKTPENIRETLLANGYRQEDMVKLSEKASGGKRWGREMVSTKNNIDLELLRFSMQPRDYEEVFVFIAGHANGHGEDTVMHLPGDDLPVIELIKKLDAISAKRLFVVAAVSQGETWIQKLGRPGRIIIAGSGDRQYDFIPVIFLRIFPEVFLNPFSRSGGMENAQEASLLDIFSETQEKVKHWYKANQLQCTELALMDADGDGKGESLLMDLPEPEMIEAIPVVAGTGPAADPSVTVLESSPASGAGPKVETAEFPLNLDLPDAKASARIYFKIPKGEPA